MDLLKKAVKHIKYGQGTIIQKEADKVVVEFNELIGEKTFPYPDGFEKFLKLNDEQLNNLIFQEIQLNKEQQKIKDDEKAKHHETHSRKVAITSGKYNNKNNIAFKCNYCDGGQRDESIGYRGVCSDQVIKYNIEERKHVWCCSDDSKCYQYYLGEISRDELDNNCQEEAFVCYESKMLDIWRASAGIVQSGARKGQPMTLRELSSNMLAILTTRLIDEKEADRIIFAVFLVMGRCEGDDNVEGYVEANSDYKIELSLEEAKQMKFWEYHYNEGVPSSLAWKSGLHRYINDIQGAQIIKAICQVKNDVKEKDYANRFMEHFCKLKGLNVDDIPGPEGGLLR